MSTATTLSRITGFLRMWATAYALGATGLMSAYAVANNIPNMVFELVAGGIISSLFIPTFLELREQDGDAGAWRFASHAFNLALVALGLIALLGTVLPQPFIWTQTFRMSASEADNIRETASFFFRFFAIQIVVYGAGTILSALLNARRQFLWPALGPVFNNVVVIATMFAFALLHEDVALARTVLAIGTTLGVVAMFAVQIPSLVKHGVRYARGLGLADPAVRRMLRLAVPTLIYVLTNLVAVSVRNASAFAVADNGPSVLMYAWTFYQLPYGILAVALATAIFTELAESSGRRDWSSFKATFAKGLRVTGVLILPTSAIVVALAKPLVSLYRVGAFEAASVPAVAQALRWWAGGLLFYAGTIYLLRTFYSLKDTKTPMLVNLGLTGVQIALYFALSTGVAGWKGLGLNGMPIADVVFYALSLATLVWLLRRRIGGFDTRGIVGVYARMAASAVAGALVAALVARMLETAAAGFATSVIQVAAGGIAGLIVAFALAHALGVSEVASAISRLGRMSSRRRGRGA